MIQQPNFWFYTRHLQAGPAQRLGRPPSWHTRCRSCSWWNHSHSRAQAKASVEGLDCISRHQDEFKFSSQRPVNTAMNTHFTPPHAKIRPRNSHSGKDSPSYVSPRPPHERVRPQHLPKHNMSPCRGASTWARRSRDNRQERAGPPPGGIRDGTDRGVPATPHRPQARPGRGRAGFSRNKGV